MANDSMRGGPRGSSDQAALKGPITVQLKNAVGAAVDIDENTTDAAAVGWFGLSDIGYQVTRVRVVATETYAAEGEDILVGVYQKDGSTAVDADAFVAAGNKVPNGTTIGSEVELTMDGAGAFLDPTVAGNENFLIGGSTGYRVMATRGGTDSGGNGRFIVFVDLVPVSGNSYSG
tara:strand:+ start:708 stop:1232 length:525 start_codon:yes stop_codon:yes gene_type:complete